MKKINFKNYRLGTKIENVNLSAYGNEIEYSLYLKNIRSKKIYNLGTYTTTGGTDPYDEFTEYGWGIEYLPVSDKTINRLHKALDNDDYDVLEDFYWMHKDMCDSSVGKFYIANYDDLDMLLEVPVNTIIEAELNDNNEMCYYTGDIDNVIFEECVKEYDGYDEANEIVWYKFNNEKFFGVEIDEEENEVKLYMYSGNMAA